MKARRLLSLAIAIIMVCSSIAVFADSTFSDVEDGYWAKEYIEEMSQIGLIKGYPDGTFKPASAVSKWECLILAARVMGFNEDSNKEFIEMASKAYMPYLKKYNVNNKDEICYLLYWGVLSGSDLDAYLLDANKNKPELRYEAAVLLTQILGGVEDAKNSPGTLNYDDMSEIPASAKNYVAYVTSKSVMQGTGDNKFEPNMQVSRAQMSTMMYNAMRVMSMQAINVTVTETTGTTITAVKEDGEIVKYPMAKSGAVCLDGERAVLSDLEPGMDLTIHIQNKEIRLAEGYSEVSEKIAGGQVVTTGTDAKGEYIRIAVEDEDQNITNTNFYITSSSKITLDGKQIYLSSVKNNYYAKVYYTGNNLAYRVDLEAKTSSLNGTLVELITDPPSIIIKLGSGTIETYPILDDVSVIRGDKAASIYDLVVGDQVVLTMDYYKVRKISATGISMTVEGTIKELVYGDTCTVTVKSSGELYTANITDDTSISVDGTATDRYSLRVGQNVKVIIDSANATRIIATSVVGPSQITGVVKNINAAYSIVTMTDVTTGTETQVVIKGNCTFIDQTNSKINSISKLSAGDTIMVLGSMNNGVYTVTTLIVVS